MHGKGTFAGFLVAAALAVPPTLALRWWHWERHTSEIPVLRPAGGTTGILRFPSQPPETEAQAQAPAPSTPEPAPPPAPALTPDQEESLRWMELRDPTLSPEDQKRLRDGVARPRRPDPHARPTPPRPRVRRLRVSVEGIVSLEGRQRRAIVDGRMVGPGDRVGEARVLQVTPDGVVFQWRGKRLLRRVPD